jgi:quercetin dioxygenase-like cupin family protein
METETLRTNPPTANNSTRKDNVSYDLPTLISSMKEDYNWANKELNAVILSKDRKKQIILTSIHDGTEIESFQSKDSITFHILEGKLKFHTRDDTIILNEGQLMTLTKKIKYRLTTEEDTVFLLTISDSPKKSLNN